MQRCARRKLFFHRRLDAAIELVGLERRAKERHTGARRLAQEFFREREALGDETGGKWQAEKLTQDLQPARFFERCDVGDFRFADDLAAIGNEAFGVSCENEPGAGYLRARHRSVKSRGLTDGFKFKNVLQPIEKSAD